jgi:ribosomal protein S18 acetylase RimI-like enzyme
MKTRKVGIALIISLLIIRRVIPEAQAAKEISIEQIAFSESSLEAERQVYIESFLARHDIILTREELSAKFDDRVFHIKKCRLPVRALRAKRDDAVVGLTVGILRKRGPVYLHLLSVLPTEQKQGIGRKLLDAFISKWSPKAIELNVQKGNKPAELFYKKYGFIDLGYNPSLFGEKKHLDKYTGLIWHNPAFLSKRESKGLWARLLAFCVESRC